MANQKAPLSESVAKQHYDWTEEQCLSELRRIAELDPKKVVTRNYFRNHSKISESTWNRYFGTFSEYKRKANIILSRQQHKLEQEIAKHASVDHYRELNKEREEWGAKYRRVRNGRWQTVMVISDLHDIMVDRFYLSTIIATAKRVMPDIIALGGDIFDLTEFGRFTVDPREWDVVGRIKFVHEKILGSLRKACPDAQMDFIEGNHEFRLLRHMADATPALMTVLSDLHGFTIPKLLGLERFEINYVAKGDLAAYRVTDIKKEVSRSYKTYFDCFIVHHFPSGKNLGLSGCNGHHHKWQTWSEYHELHGSYQWTQLGCGHVCDASYADGLKWNNGFLLAHIDTQSKAVNHEYISITDQAVVGGKFYYRE